MLLDTVGRLRIFVRVLASDVHAEAVGRLKRSVAIFAPCALELSGRRLRFRRALHVTLMFLDAFGGKEALAERALRILRRFLSGHFCVRGELRAQTVGECLIAGR